jgi:hypothetical protein
VIEARIKRIAAVESLQFLLIYIQMIMPGTIATLAIVIHIGNSFFQGLIIGT